MTITTEAFIDEPIVFVTVEGNTDENQIQEMHEKVLEACQHLGSCFIILDLRGTTATLHEYVTLLLSARSMLKNRQDSLHITVVGRPSPQESLENFPYPVLPDRASALQHVRNQISIHGSKGTVSGLDNGRT